MSDSSKMSSLISTQKTTVSTKKFKDAITTIDALDFLLHQKEELKIYALQTCDQRPS